MAAIDRLCKVRRLQRRMRPAESHPLLPLMALRAAALDGIGIAVLPSWAAAEPRRSC